MKNIDRAVEITKAAIMEKGIPYTEGRGDMPGKETAAFLKAMKKALDELNPEKPPE